MNTQYHTNVPFVSKQAAVVAPPPLFSKFGSVAKDLFKKNFEYEHSLKVKSKTATGHSFENGAILGDNNNIRGYLKYSYNVPNYGVLSADIFSDASSESKATMEFNKLTKGLKVRTIAASNASNKDLKSNTASLEVDYIVDRIALGAAVKTDGNAHKIHLNGALAHNGVAVGGEVHLNSNPAFSVAEKNFGIQFTQNDYLCAVVTEKNASVLATHIYQLTPHNYALGSSFRVNIKNKSDRTLAVGGIFNCSPATTVKVKAEVPTGNVSAHIAHQLVNPNVLANFSLTSNVRDTLSLKAEKFGLGLTLGSL